MNCDELEDRLTDGEDAELREHLAACSACRRAQAVLGLPGLVARSARPLSPDLREKILAATAPRPRMRLRHSLLVAALAAAVLGFAALLRPSQAPPVRPAQDALADVTTHGAPDVTTHGAPTVPFTPATVPAAIDAVDTMDRALTMGFESAAIGSSAVLTVTLDRLTQDELRRALDALESEGALSTLEHARLSVRINAAFVSSEDRLAILKEVTERSERLMKQAVMPTGK